MTISLVLYPDVSMQYELFQVNFKQSTQVESKEEQRQSNNEAILALLDATEEEDYQVQNNTEQSNSTLAVNITFTDITWEQITESSQNLTLQSGDVVDIPEEDDEAYQELITFYPSELFNP